MSITLTKIHNGDLVIDNSQTWSDGPEQGFVIGRDADQRFEIVWEDGVRSFERLDTLSSPEWRTVCTHRHVCPDPRFHKSECAH